MSERRCKEFGCNGSIQEKGLCEWHLKKYGDTVGYLVADKIDKTISPSKRE